MVNVFLSTYAISLTRRRRKEEFCTQLRVFQINNHKNEASNCLNQLKYRIFNLNGYRDLATDDAKIIQQVEYLKSSRAMIS